MKLFYLAFISSSVRSRYERSRKDVEIAGSHRPSCPLLRRILSRRITCTLCEETGLTPSRLRQLPLLARRHVDNGKSLKTFYCFR